MKRQLAPILVTGCPRSGTTWMARLLALAEGTALAGREPMNPKHHQYALGGTLDGWARLTSPSRRQRLSLRLAYRGLTPFVYGRYGHRQWATALPRTRVVVRDPFAMLSLPTVARLTGAVSVLVYRHPAAQLASYRRMGWRVDTVEVQEIIEQSRREGGPDLPDLPPEGSVSDAEEMGHFWRTLYELALADLEAPGATHEVVLASHGRVAAGGPETARRLAAHLGLIWTPEMELEVAKEGSASVSATRLHNLDRAPAQVAEAWRSEVDPDDVVLIEDVAGETLARLDQLNLAW